MIIIGTAAGFIATRMLKLNLSVPETIALGVIGALIGGLVLRVLLAVMGMAAGLVGAVIGVVLLILVYRQFFEKK